MQLHTLKPVLGAKKREKRIGRGGGSGRGDKGAQSRSGYKRKRGFEGGQLPLQRRLPKFGFKNPCRVQFKAINIALLQQLADKAKTEIIDFNVLIQHGLVKKTDRYKILGDGKLTAKLQVTAHAFSEAARAAIQQVGGQAMTIDFNA